MLQPSYTRWATPVIASASYPPVIMSSHVCSAITIRAVGRLIPPPFTPASPCMIHHIQQAGIPRFPDAAPITVAHRSIGVGCRRCCHRRLSPCHWRRLWAPEIHLRAGNFLESNHLAVRLPSGAKSDQRVARGSVAKKCGLQLSTLCLGVGLTRSSRLTSPVTHGASDAARAFTRRTFAHLHRAHQACLRVAVQTLAAV